jgi:hypothetical protein
MSAAVRKRGRSPGSIVAVIVALACAAVVDADDSLVCGNSLVTVGMAAGEIVARCGEPRTKAVEDIPIRVRHPNGTVGTAGIQHIERWTYDRGYGKFPALLTFEEGKLRSIELLTRP